MREITVTTSDDYRLMATVFEPTKPNGRVLLINAAMAVRQGYYADFAQSASQQGFVAVTYDYRGIGKSRQGHLRHIHASLETWATRDQLALMQWISTQYPTMVLLMVGHSVGGQLIGLNPDYERIHAVLMVACQSGYWRLWQGRWQWLMGTMGFVLLPFASQIVGYYPGKQLGIGDDVPKGVAQQWGTAIRHPQYVDAVFRNHPDHHYADMQVPIRAYSFADDHYAPRQNTDALLAIYANAPHEHIHIVPQSVGLKTIGHFGFFRATLGVALWQPCFDWLAQI